MLEIRLKIHFYRLTIFYNVFIKIFVNIILTCFCVGIFCFTQGKKHDWTSIGFKKRFDCLSLQWQ
ncbi:hypothetical protein EF868_01760 [Campylobacter upsaliensis]|nr:hypothetical protein [Campylobacter upsaliensis]